MARRSSAGVARRIGVAAAIAAGVLTTASCAAGQHAATADEVTVIDGTNGTVGSIELEGVAIQAPSTGYYTAGSSAGMAVVVVNNGGTDDTLNSVTSSAYAGWSIVPTSSLGSGSSSGQGTPTAIPAGTALRLGLTNLGGSSPTSPKTLELSTLAKGASPLYPGSSVKVTFTFAKAGSTTLTVPVKLTSAPNGQTLPAPSTSTAEG